MNEGSNAKAGNGIMPKPVLNRSNSRSISVRRERQTSGTLAGAGAERFTGTGVVAMECFSFAG